MAEVKNRLTLLTPRIKRAHNRHWVSEYLCECGVIKEIRDLNVKQGITSSCGCLKKEQNKEPKTHGKTGTRAHSIWMKMLDRCRNPNTIHYARYGGRGIQVCERWNRFENFLFDMGNPTEQQTLERINNDGNYEPSNCRWATRKEQANNRSNNKLLTLNGESKTVSQWAEQLGMKPQVLDSRLKRGWTVEEALQTPRQKYERKR